jgi:hypothetical protein
MDRAAADAEAHCPSFALPDWMEAGATPTTAISGLARIHSDPQWCSGFPSSSPLPLNRNHSFIHPSYSHDLTMSLYWIHVVSNFMCLMCSLYGFARRKFGIRRVRLRTAIQILFEEPQITLEDFFFLRRWCVLHWDWTYVLPNVCMIHSFSYVHVEVFLLLPGEDR